MELQKIGKIQKIHGFKGWLQLKINKEFIVDWENTSCLFLGINGIPTPYFIEEKAIQDKLYIRFENHLSDKDSRPLVGTEISIQKNLISEEENEFDYLIHKIVIDKTAGTLGAVIRIEKYPQQELMVIQKNGKEILLPIVEEFIIKIDEEKNEIHYQAPDGLIDIYLV